MLGLPDPQEQSSLPLLKRIQAGVRQVWALKGPSGRQVRFPITLKILAGMQESLSQSTEMDRIVLWTIACLAFFGFFRLGKLLQSSGSSYVEARDLSWGDVAVDNRESPHMVQVHLKSSKSDQFGQGADVVVGRTGVSVCPVEAMAQYLGIRGSGPGSFFIDSAGKALVKTVFVNKVRDFWMVWGCHQASMRATASGSAQPLQQH